MRDLWLVWEYDTTGDDHAEVMGIFETEADALALVELLNQRGSEWFAYGTSQELLHESGERATDTQLVRVILDDKGMGVIDGPRTTDPRDHAPQRVEEWRENCVIFHGADRKATILAAQTAHETAHESPNHE